jgi:hypothetical protein
MLEHMNKVEYKYPNGEHLSQIVAYVPIENISEKQVSTSLSVQKEIILLQKLREAGFLLITPEFVKEYISVLYRDGDICEHWYYNYGKPDSKRIISISREPKITYGWNVDDLFNNNYTVRAEIQYY